MTELLDRAVRAARSLPQATQDDIARIVLMIAGEDQPAIQLSQEEEASFGKSMAQAARGEFATDEQVSAVWAKHGL